MRKSLEELLWWLNPDQLIWGNETEGGNSGEEGGGEEGEEESESEEEESEESEESEDEDDDSKRDTAGLKSALQKERRAAKQAAKDLKAANKRLEELDQKDKSEIEKAKTAQAKADEKVTKLATRLRTQAVDVAIKDAARALKFKDEDDAVSLVSRKDISVEQDEDDPSDIEIDLKSVKAAVKALADRKKHLIDAEGEGEKSGSKFGGKGGDKQKQTEESLKELYPAL